MHSLESLILNYGATEFYLYDLYININKLWCDRNHNNILDNNNNNKCDETNNLSHQYQSKNCLHIIQNVMHIPNYPILSLSLWKTMNIQSILNTLNSLRHHENETESSVIDHQSAQLPRFLSIQRGTIELMSKAIPMDELKNVWGQFYYSRGLLDSPQDFHPRCF